MESKENIAIHCENISKEFATKGKKIRVIDNLTLNIYDNEFVVLYGPGQCGKTTIINILSGLESPSTGEVYQKNEKVMGPGPQRAVVYQSISLFPWLTVMGNVEFGLRAAGIETSKRRQRAQDLIDLVGLHGFENAFPNSLSGGMQQRVGIARAYCIAPSILFMDEPFGALDAQTRYMMEQEIIRINSKEKRTILFVTNNIEEAIYLADRIIVLNNCPTSIKKEYKVEWGKPRDYTDKKFLDLREEITSIVDETP
jgi:NitT/TauT family transport system ATP-binding protein/sulfonate transport system ATP-binding protein